MRSLTHQFIKKFVLRVLITTFVIVGIGGRFVFESPPAMGQFTLPNTPVLSSSYPPSSVERFGGIETAPVRSPFFVKDLFRVAAPTVYDRDGKYQDGNVPVELRAELIEANLRRAMSLLKDAETVRVNKSILNGSIVLQVSDQHVSRSINLLTVTDLDASFNAQTPDEVADEWRSTLQEEFVQIVEDKAKFGQQILKASQILLGMVMIVAALQLLHWWLQRRNRELKRQVAEQEIAMHQTEDTSTTATLAVSAEPDSASNTPQKSSDEAEQTSEADTEPATKSTSAAMLFSSSTTTPIVADVGITDAGVTNAKAISAEETSSERTSDKGKSDPDEAQGKNLQAALLPESIMPPSLQERLPEVRSHFVEIFNTQLTLRRRRRINRFLRWLVFWCEVLVVYLGAIWITRSVTIWNRAKLWLLGLPIDILLVAFGTSLAIRISHWLIHQIAESSEDYNLLTLGESERRRLLRITTISRVLEGIATALFCTIGIIFILESLGVPTQSILAGGAVVAFAISFGSQSLVKDIITGCFILIEDQYAVGDVVGIGDVSGLVETLNLRVTQLRDAEGQLITIPNSCITQVKNLTRLWSRVDFTVTAAYDTDPKKLLTLLQTIGAEMIAESEWAAKLLEPPTVMGIDRLSHEGMLARVWIKTKPLQQWATGREYRYRVRQAFEQEGIEIGKPQWVLTQPDDSKYLDYDKYSKNTPWL